MLQAKNSPERVDPEYRLGWEEEGPKKTAVDKRDWKRLAKLPDLKEGRN